MTVLGAPMPLSEDTVHSSLGCPLQSRKHPVLDFVASDQLNLRRQESLDREMGNAFSQLILGHWNKDKPHPTSVKEKEARVITLPSFPLILHTEEDLGLGLSPRDDRMVLLPSPPPFHSLACVQSSCPSLSPVCSLPRGPKHMAWIMPCSLWPD